MERVEVIFAHFTDECAILEICTISDISCSFRVVIQSNHPPLRGGSRPPCYLYPIFLFFLFFHPFS